MNGWIILSFLTLVNLANPNFAELDKSVVLILNQQGNIGTGFVINQRPQVVTNYHVVANGGSLSAALSQDHRTEHIALKPAQLIWFSQEKDLALLEVPGLNCPTLPLTPFEPDKGSPVYAIGFPEAAEVLTERLTAESSVTMGTLSRMINATWEGNTSPFRIIQHTSEINSGNSGGPLLNTCGQVIGINTVKTSLVASLTSGEIISGVFFAGHSSVLIDALKNQHIPFTEITQPCIITEKNPEYISQNNWIQWTIIAILTALLILLLILRQKQQFLMAIPQSNYPKSHSNPTTPTPQTTYSLIEQTSQQALYHIPKTQAYTWDKGWVIGSSPQLADCVFPQINLSNRHARLILLKNQLHIEDLNSFTGTWVNGQQLKPFQPLPLTSGNLIKMGHLELQLVISA